MKINNFRGERIGISAKNEALIALFSVFVSADVSDRSPQKPSILIMTNNVHWIKASLKNVILNLEMNSLAFFVH